MTDSNHNAGNFPYYDGRGDQHSTSSTSASGLLDLLDIASWNRSMNQTQASVNGGHDLVQAVLLRNLLWSNTAVSQSNQLRASTLINSASIAGLNQPTPSDLTLLNLLNSSADDAARPFQTTRQDELLLANLPNLPVTNPMTTDLFHYVLASQNKSLRELSLRLNSGVSEPPSALLSLPAASPIVTGNIGASMLHAQPFLGHVIHKGDDFLRSQLLNTSSIPNNKSRPQQSNHPPKTNSEGDYIIPVFTEEEKYVLSEYQSYLRQQMVYVETEYAAARKGGKIQGRNKAITAGQVGVMCVHCAKIPYDARPRGAVYYPATLEGIYQAAQNMSKNHFEVRCQVIPDAVRDRLNHLKRTKSVNLGTGKEYWKKSAENIGICEVDSRLFFEKSVFHKKG